MQVRERHKKTLPGYPLLYGKEERLQPLCSFCVRKVSERDGVRGIKVPPLYSYSYNETKPEVSVLVMLFHEGSQSNIQR